MENKTVAFYGDLVEAAMSKNVKRMVELVDTLDAKQMAVLGIALMDLAMILSAVGQIRIDRWR